MASQEGHSQGLTTRDAAMVVPPESPPFRARRFKNFVEALVALVTQQLACHFDTYTSLETKAIGLLAFDSALGAFTAVLHPMPEYLRWIFFTPLVISVLGCICSLWVRTVYTGPNVKALYKSTTPA